MAHTMYVVLNESNFKADDGTKVHESGGYLGIAFTQEEARCLMEKIIKECHTNDQCEIERLSDNQDIVYVHDKLNGNIVYYVHPTEVYEES